MKNLKYYLGGVGLAAGAAGLMLSKRRSYIPKGVTAVKPFDINRYLGEWFEIARIDFAPEKNLKNVSAIYRLDNDGSIAVTNRGYDFQKGEWKEKSGKARFTGNPDEGRLKVSFFGPFYSGYNVLAVDSDYNCALVGGDDFKHLWILSRDKDIPAQTKAAYLTLARTLGYNTADLIWTTHDEPSIIL